MELLDRLAEDPARAAVLFDVDGVLAPIVPRPEDAHVPVELRDELRRLDARYALVACVSGRDGADASTVVGVPELTYVGNHGLELEPEADEWAARLDEFLGTVDWPQIENKRLTASLHYRAAPDEAAARRELDAVAQRARDAGLVARYGRKVLELVPPLAAHKGTAIRRLLDERRLVRALYAGDDTTDLDAFTALDVLELGICVAVASPEGPQELRERADIVLGSQREVIDLLRAL
ncbi:MAG TPA: trehalose-phosphatase [Gaiellaceae bacterium]|nr:trehalose-phosphatase [Gaiellaceae bacterium]